MSRRHVLIATVAAVGLSGCVEAWQKPKSSESGWPVLLDTCDYDAIAATAIKERYPWFSPPGKLASAQYQDVMIAFYPPTDVMPGGTAHATVGVRDCRVKEVWITQ